MIKQIYFYIFFSFVIGMTEAPKLFQYNQSTFQAFYFFKNVMIDSAFVESDDWVGTFNCMEWDADSTYCNKLGSCVGSRRWNTEKCGGGICDLPAMGNVGDATQKTDGYLESGQYPVFVVYDKSKGAYYRAKSYGDVVIQQDVCRNGYPYCYAWENFNFYFIETLNADEIYMDCAGKLRGTSIIDNCGICSGTGPQFYCELNNKSYCTEYEFEQNCSK